MWIRCATEGFKTRLALFDAAKRGRCDDARQGSERKWELRRILWQFMDIKLLNNENIHPAQDHQQIEYEGRSARY